jgi:hypothetical protein
MLPFNLIDLLIICFLLAGILRGRKRGLSQEFPALLKWLTLLIVCTVLYQPVGLAITKFGFFDLLSSYLLAYLATALILFLIFSVIQRGMRSKLTGSDVFGRSEYYLGMSSGFVRFSCMLLMMLALLNARAFTPAEVKARQKFQEDLYGSFLFPDLHTFQELVFERSLAGRWIKKDLGFLLITPTERDEKEPQQARQPAPVPTDRKA